MGDFGWFSPFGIAALLTIGDHGRARRRKRVASPEKRAKRKAQKAARKTTRRNK